MKAELTTGPIGRTLARLTTYMIFGFFATIAFNLVDTWFVAKLGTKELAAMGFIFPVVMIIGAIAIGLGIGTSALVSRTIGEGNQQGVRRLTTDALALSVLAVLLFIIIGLLTIRPVFTLLGASPEILKLIRVYMLIWYPGMLFLVIPMVGNNAIRATGDMKFPSIIMIFSVFVNLGMDPLLIFGIGPFPRWGLAGAAAATVVARALTLVLMLFVLHKRHHMLSFDWPGLHTVIQSWKSVLNVSIPAAGSNLIRPLGVTVVTGIVARFGPEAVAGYGVCTRVETLALMVLIALSTVLSPFVGQNLGAGRLDRVQGAIHRSQLFSLGWGGFSAIILFLLARPIAHMFSRDAEVVRTIVVYLRIVPVVYGFRGVFGLSNAVLNVLKRAWDVMALSVIQMFVLLIPGAIVGAKLWGLTGLFGLSALSWFFSSLISAWWLARGMKKLIRNNG
ncbi:MAG: MATE family efflux transporter [Acidobacteria bacterium]|nr:MAG: MATE family efflux transporter [Acidobacteriota bacterium]RLE23493.1 MAG: MATE family efflux transporter [Acidobacteriota bacterium]